MMKNCIDDALTFDNFIAGTGNEFAHAACLAVTKRPGKDYNPLYLYSGHGLGKTHLAHAIANEFVRKGCTNILLRTGEGFCMELIQAIQNNSLDQFRNQYCQLDALIVDDVQFFAGKPKTQEAFLQIFNVLYEKKKQLVLTSFESPRDLKNIMEPLMVRFHWGLIADVQLPDLKTRREILCNAVQAADIALDEGVADLLCSRVTSSIQGLKGALFRLNAYAALTNKTIDLHLAHYVLGDILNVDDQEDSFEEIRGNIDVYFNRSKGDKKDG